MSIIIQLNNDHFTRLKYCLHGNEENKNLFNQTALEMAELFVQRSVKI